jgi:hypothetical protein
LPPAGLKHPWLPKVGINDIFATPVVFSFFSLEKFLLKARERIIAADSTQYFFTTYFQKL